MPSRIEWVALALAAALAPAACGGGEPAAEDGQYRAPRLAGTEHPDLNGIWQAVGTAHWDVEDHVAQPAPILEMGAIGAVPAGRGVVDGAIPYLPEAAEQKRRNFEERMVVDPWNRDIGDPVVKCYLPGVPRATLPARTRSRSCRAPTRSPSRTSSRARRASSTSRNHEEPAIDSWMGWSNGRWDGDTLVVDVTGFNGDHLVRPGRQLPQHRAARGRALHARRRRITSTTRSPIEDPNVFERPWTMRMPLYRRMDAEAQVMDFRCLEFVEPLLLGSLSNPAP